MKEKTISPSTASLKSLPLDAQDFLKTQVEKVLTEQYEFIQKLLISKTVFDTAEDFEKNVVGALNSISESNNIKSHYFSHNGFDNKSYCSLVCSGC